MSLANSEKMDSCPKDIIKTGKLDIGRHCCKLYCPYDDIDLNKNCNGAGTVCSSTGTHRYFTTMVRVIHCVVPDLVENRRHC